MKMALNLMLALILSCLVGCASKEELQKRKDNAFDSSGTYATIKAESEIDFGMVITNESSASDVLVSVMRPQLTTTETEFFKNLGLDPAKVMTLIGTTMPLGRGKQHELEGGENISDDFGASSKLSVDGDDYVYDSSWTITYRMSGVTLKSDMIMRGYLTATAVKSTPSTDANGKPVTKRESYSQSLKFAASNGKPFYMQYFGSWTGAISINSGVNSDANKITSLTLVSTGADTYSLSAGYSSITRDGKTFNYQAINYSVVDLAKNDIPTLQINFKGDDGSYLILYGEIWSLGTFTGSLVYVSGTTTTSLGSFTFKKVK